MNKKIDIGSFEDLLRIVEGSGNKAKHVDVSNEQSIIRQAESGALKKDKTSWVERVSTYKDDKSRGRE
ncbi:MAG: hypothetical protein RLZZ59_707 [Pseudomonadota bacterium]|jgi:hypothetical protein